LLGLAQFRQASGFDKPGGPPGCLLKRKTARREMGLSAARLFQEHRTIKV
jgi:hypothetical protein